MTYDLEDWYEADGVTPRTFANPIGSGDPFPVIVTDLRSDVDALVFSVTSVNTQTGEVVLTAVDVGAVPTSLIGATGGFAPLDADGLTPVEFLPPFVFDVQGQSGSVQLAAVDIPFDPTGFTGTLVGKTQLQEVTEVIDALVFTGGTVTSINLMTGVVTLTAADVGAVDLTAVGANDGVAPLDGTGTVPVLNLPPFVATIGGNSGTVATIGADIVTLDESGFVGLLTTTPTPDVQELAAKVDAIPTTATGLVNSVNSQIGNVQLNALDIPVNTAGFAGNLDAGDIDLQAVADAFDAFVIPADAVLSVNTLTGDVVLGPDEIGALDVDLLAAADGVAPLDVDGFVPYVNLPPLPTSINTLTGDIVLTGDMIAIDATGFSGNLDASHINAQLVADALDALNPPSSAVTSVNAFTGEVVLAAADLGAVDVALVGAVDGIAPLDAAATVPTTNLPDVVFSINSMGGVVALDAAAIPVDDSGFVGNLVGITDLQGVSDIVDAFTGGSGGGHTLEEAGTPFTQRANMNFLAPFNLTDNSGADSTEVALDTIPLTLGGTEATTASGARTSLGVYSTTEVDTLVNTTAANVGKRVSVIAATTANITIATALNNGDTLDGITLATSDLVLVKNQTAPAENGVYVVGVSPARDTNFDTWADYPSSLASVVSGTAGALTVWLCTSNTGGTLNTTAITYSQIATGGGTMAAQNASAVAITGGTLAGLTSLAMANSSLSAGALVGGIQSNVAAIDLVQNYTQTANPTTPLTGTPIRIVYSPTINYPNWSTQSGLYGPRALINVEGQTNYSYSNPNFQPTPIAFGTMMRFGNTPGIGVRMCPGWSIMGVDIFTADGATVTTQRNDFHTGGASFVDSRTLITANSGVFDHTASELIGFLTGPMILGFTTVGTRVGFDVKDVNDYPGGATIIAAGMDSNLVPGSDVRLGTVNTNIGVRIPRMTLGTVNVGIRCDTGIQLWMDTNTTSAQPGPVIEVGGIHTINTSGIVSQGINYAPTAIYQQTAVANGQGSTIFNGQPVYKNHPSKSGSVWPYSASFLISPTYQADTNAVTAGTLQQIFARTSLARANTLGTLAVTTAEEFVAATIVGIGTSIGTRYGLHITEATGSGTVGTQIGIQIESLNKGNVINYGIVNFSSSVLQGPIIGGFLSGQNMVLQSNGSKDGSFQFDSPFLEVAVSNYTHTTSSPSTIWIDSTVTMNGAAQNTFRLLDNRAVVSFQQTGVTGIFGVGANTVYDRAQYQNVSASGNLNLGAIAAFSSNPTITANAPGAGSIVSSPFVVSFDSHPFYTRVTNGSLVIDNQTGFVSSGSIGANCTVTERRGFDVRDPDGAGTLTTNIGVNILLQTKGATNIGLKNASTTVLPETVATVVNAGAILIPSSSTIRLNNTTAGSITLSSTPTMLDGQDGQMIEIYNGSAQNVVLQNQGTLAGSNLRLTTTTITLAPRGSITLKYSTTIGDWREISRAAVI